jgi:hypothetical protein
LHIKGDHVPFRSENLDRAPDSPGVYLLETRSETVYFGTARDSVRSRLRQHLAGHAGGCTQAATHFRAEAHGRPIARQRELLRGHLRAFGRIPECNDAIP